MINTNLETFHWNMHFIKEIGKCIQYLFCNKENRRNIISFWHHTTAMDQICFMLPAKSCSQFFVLNNCCYWSCKLCLWLCFVSKCNAICFFFKWAYLSIFTICNDLCHLTKSGNQRKIYEDAHWHLWPPMCFVLIPNTFWTFFQIFICLPFEQNT